MKKHVISEYCKDPYGPARAMSGIGTLPEELQKKQVCKALGFDPYDTPLDKGDYEWAFIFDGVLFTIYPYKKDLALHVGGEYSSCRSNKLLPKLIEFLKKKGELKMKRGVYIVSEYFDAEDTFKLTPYVFSTMKTYDKTHKAALKHFLEKGKDLYGTDFDTKKATETGLVTAHGCSVSLSLTDGVWNGGKNAGGSDTDMPGTTTD